MSDNIKRGSTVRTGDTSTSGSESNVVEFRPRANVAVGRIAFDLSKPLLIDVWIGFPDGGVSAHFHRADTNEATKDGTAEVHIAVTSFVTKQDPISELRFVLESIEQYGSGFEPVEEIPK